MPKGPQGKKRPADGIGAAVMFAQIATGERQEETASGRERSVKAGGTAHAEGLSLETRSEIAAKAAEARWG